MTVQAEDPPPMHHEILQIGLSAPEDVLGARVRVLAVARRLGIEPERRLRLATALSRAAAAVCAAGGGGLVVDVGAAGIAATVRGPADALREAAEAIRERVSEAELAAGLDGNSTLRVVEPLPRGTESDRRPAAPDVPDLLAALAEEDAELVALVEAMEARDGDYARLNRELEETNRGVVALYAELDERDRRKNEFLATLAHELRNPMSIIGTALHTLRMTAGPEDGGARLLGVAERQLRHLARLVDDLLDVSRIDQDKIKLQREAVDLVAVVERAVDTRRAGLAEKGHELAVEVRDRPLPLWADPDRVEQVVDNLLSNATKYTPEGGHVAVVAAREGNEAVLTVTDDGIGIPPEMLDRVFQVFAQADPSLERSAGGLGLGLSLVDRLVALHGGTVVAHSEGEGKGSRFTVRLPLSRQSAEPAGAADGAEPPAAGREGSGEGAGERPGVGPAVLLVEDNADAREMMALLLEGRGYRVGTAADGREGVEKASSGEWDVAIVDIGLPELDGYEVARRVRGSDAGAGLLLIALSGYGRPEDCEKSVEAGFDRHLVKPVEPDELFQLLSTAGR